MSRPLKCDYAVTSVCWILLSQPA